MDFLCCCKPLKNDGISGKPFEIPLTSSPGEERGVIQTYDITPSKIGLELSVFDCYRSYEKSEDVGGWSIMSAPKGDM